MDQKNPNIVSGRGYGFRQWGQLFNPRQLLALCTFGKWVREAHRRILQETNDPDFAKAVATYLAFVVDLTRTVTVPCALEVTQMTESMSFWSPPAYDLGLRRR
jgi:adenine-specific DNA methylase